ncbi:E3 ubiquitin-protein ligase LRSAM1-like isoform X2 [Pecten maximus]|nr:E3 ubiquitin-protein ligase LRSAM1-like isoform X2 [Pecten maximus]
MQHRCTKAVAGDTATCSSASTTSSRNIEDVGDSEDRTMFECDVCKGWFLDMKTFDRHDCIMNTGNASNESPLAAASSSSSSEKECVVCMEDGKHPNCVFVDCGHLVVCMDCGSRCNTCPVCREEIKQRIKVFP